MQTQNDPIKLTDQKFKEIYSNERFRNQVAHAHACYDSSGRFKFRQTCSYPTKYVVTENQILEAKRELERAKALTIETNKNKLMLVGMGSTYKPNYPDDVCNHRVRGKFQNPSGNLFFIEFCLSMPAKGEKFTNKFYIPHAEQLTKDGKTLEDHYNYQGLQSNRKRVENCAYTQTTLLKIVNTYFMCNFKEIVIDNYNVAPEEFISLSPAFQ